MSADSAPSDGLVNQGFEPILMSALKRFRALLPSEVGLALELSHDGSLLRANSRRLEDALFSACLVAWQSMAGLATQVVVELKEVILDNIVLDSNAEKLQGGLPPRRCFWLVISSSSRTPAGPFHTLMLAPVQIDKRPGEAHRLPLTEVRDIILQHHGTMTVSPEPGKGTLLEFFLPSALPLEMAFVSGSGACVRHIYYVDDYEAMRIAVSETLADAGFRVSCFESGKDALAAFQADPSACDALVSDYRLQGFSGIELLKQIKRLRADLPVIIISGYVDEALKSMAHDGGAALVVSKTDDIGELCVALRELLGDTPSPEMATYSEWVKF